MIDQYYVGQRVVCINDNYGSCIAEWCNVFPRKGRVYTVKRVLVCPDTFTHEAGVGLFLEELNNFTDRFCYSAWRFKPVVVRSECVASLHAFATSLEPCTFESGVTLKPGQFAAELNMMRAVPGLWPSRAFAEALDACGLLGSVERRAFCDFGWPARFNASWLKRLDRYYANVLAHAAAAGD
jgi:hypothetical protein